VGLDVRRPRLSWTLASDQRGQKQTAYRILASSSTEELDRDEGDLWDSGKVPSDKRSTLPMRPIAPIPDARMVESACLGQGRPRFRVERAGHLDDGTACIVRLAGKVDWRIPPP